MLKNTYIYIHIYIYICNYVYLSSIRVCYIYICYMGPVRETLSPNSNVKASSPGTSCSDSTASAATSRFCRWSLRGILAVEDHSSLLLVLKAFVRFFTASTNGF